MKIDEKAYHRHTLANREEIKRSTTCGCASCVCLFPARDIVDYYEDKRGDTAVCPYCLVDAVIGDASGLPLSESVLLSLHKKWF